jgi:hypothetical protein
MTDLLGQPVLDQRRLSDVRRQSIAHLVHLRRDGGAKIVITPSSCDAARAVSTLARWT